MSFFACAKKGTKETHPGALALRASLEKRLLLQGRFDAPSWLIKIEMHIHVHFPFSVKDHDGQMSYDIFSVKDHDGQMSYDILPIDYLSSLGYNRIDSPIPGCMKRGCKP